MRPAMGHSRRFDRSIAMSGLPPTPDRQARVENSREGLTAEVRNRARGRGLPINGRECAHDLIYARLKFRDRERLFEKG